MEKLLSLCVLLLVTVAKGGGAITSRAYQIHTLRTKVDHFGFHNTDTFLMRYAIADQFWDSDGGPIFFYTGNENPVEHFIENTGLMWDWALEFRAMLVFAEHRFYGESLPYGDESFESTEALGYLTSDQALADYADLALHLRGVMPGAEESPVVAFGGSYGGMLAAWFRIKYPHLVTAALASSAPVLMFPGLSPCNEFNNILTNTFRNVSPLCSGAIRKSWRLLENKASTVKGAKKLGEKFRLCQELHPNNYTAFRDWLREIYSTLSIANYPTPSELIPGSPLPAKPVKEACKCLSKNVNNDDAIIDGVQKVADMLFNGSRSRRCNDINIFNGNETTSWRFQGCTELVMPVCGNGVTDMFYPYTWNRTEERLKCQQKFNVTPDLYKGVMSYGGKNLESASNIIFSNGDEDPWYAVGITESVSDSVIAIAIPGGAHHNDLRSEDITDPVSVRTARALEKKYIREWINTPELSDARARVVNKFKDAHPLFRFLF